MVFYSRKVILVCLCAVMMLSPSIAPAQTTPASDQINKETKSTNQIESQQKKPPWKKVKKEIPQQGIQSQPKTQPKPEKKKK